MGGERAALARIDVPPPHVQEHLLVALPGEYVQPTTDLDDKLDYQGQAAAPLEVASLVETLPRDEACRNFSKMRQRCSVPLCVSGRAVRAVGRGRLPHVIRPHVNNEIASKCGSLWMRQLHPRSGD